jgi:hypothetical protein
MAKRENISEKQFINAVGGNSPQRIFNYLIKNLNKKEEEIDARELEERRKEYLEGLKRAYQERLNQIERKLSEGLRKNQEKSLREIEELKESLQKILNQAKKGGNVSTKYFLSSDVNGASLPGPGEIGKNITKRAKMEDMNIRTLKEKYNAKAYLINNVIDTKLSSKPIESATTAKREFYNMEEILKEAEKRGYPRKKFLSKEVGRLNLKPVETYREKIREKIGEKIKKITKEKEILREAMENYQKEYKNLENARNFYEKNKSNWKQSEEILKEIERREKEVKDAEKEYFKATKKIGNKEEKDVLEELNTFKRALAIIG